MIVTGLGVVLAIVLAWIAIGLAGLLAPRWRLGRWPSRVEPARRWPLAATDRRSRTQTAVPLTRKPECRCACRLLQLAPIRFWRGQE